MRFAALAYAHLLWLLPALLALYIYAFARKRQALAEFLEVVLTPRLVPTLSRVRQWCKALCLIGAVGCLVLALMQPQWVQVLQKEGGHRLGLVVFAGQASLPCPLTLDYGFFLQQLNQVGPHTVTRGGTLIGDAIRKALSAFGPLANNYKDIILITDGEDHDSFPLEAAKAAAAEQVSIYTIGVGDAVSGTRVPVPGTSG